MGSISSSMADSSRASKRPRDAVVAIRLTGNVASVASLVAFITLCDIASRSGSMMLGRYLQLMPFEDECSASA